VIKDAEYELHITTERRNV